MSAAFTGLDVGLPGGALHPDSAQSLVNVTHGAEKIARSQFAMAGVDGVFTHDLGARGRDVTWRLDLRCFSLAVLNEIETAIDLRKRSGEGQLRSTTGKIWLRAILRDYQPGQGFQVIRSGTLAGWVTRTDTLVFEVQI